MRTQLKLKHNFYVLHYCLHLYLVFLMEFLSQGDLWENWGAEALKWTMECTSQNLGSHSHQIYHDLCLSVTSDTCVSLL